MRRIIDTKTPSKLSNSVDIGKRGYHRVLFSIPILLLILGITAMNAMLGCSNIGSKGGIWVVTKAYLGDKVYFEKEYDDSGLIMRMTGYHNGDNSSVSYTTGYEYEGANAEIYTCIEKSYDEKGVEGDTREERSQCELDKEGRVLTEHLWPSSKGSLDERDFKEESAIVSSYKYDEDGNIREIVNKDPNGESFFSAYKSISYDTHGFARFYRANNANSYNSDIKDVTYELSYSENALPQAVTVDGSKFAFDTDQDGNITAIRNDKGELLRQFEYKYIGSPKRWISRHESVYVGCADW